MGIDNLSVGSQIAFLRAGKKMTQSELGERLNVSFQAVSKWERGETLPDVSILPDLAAVLETTTDNILCSDTRRISYRGTVKTADMAEGISCLKRMGELLGKENMIYRGAVNGINTAMNTNIEDAFSDDYIFEAFVAEAIIHNLKEGMYIDITDIRRHFKHKHFSDIVCNYAGKYNII